MAGPSVGDAATKLMRILAAAGLLGTFGGRGFIPVVLRIWPKY